MGSRRSIRYLTAFFGMAAVASLAAIPLGGASAGSVAAAPTVRLTDRMAPAVGMVGEPLYQKTEGPSQPGLFPCQVPQSATNPVPCYAPAQIRRAYDIPRYLTGAGQTIVIIDAFGDPTVDSDLALFDSTFGLPTPTLNVICPDGCPAFNPSSADEVGWAGEISLDVQWSHAMAPGATIDLVVALSDQDPDILAALQYVVGNNLGDVLSQSYGQGETCMAPSVFAAQHQAFETAASENMTVFASAGDSGAAEPDCTGTGYFLSASTPASDPLVTGVGGTHLDADFTTGAYHFETVWNNSGEPAALDFGAGGGGFSTIYPRPFYQDSAETGSAFRGVPDVTYNGDVFGGVLGVCSECNAGTPTFVIFGGTSAGPPQWSGITALADQAAGHRLGFLNPTLYAIATSPLYHYAFHDITVGNNSWDVSGVTGYSAGPGWDPASGLGSPHAAHLIKLLTSRP
jgi:subtilase family serine protease